jgi:hypothetical protein
MGRWKRSRILLRSRRAVSQLTSRHRREPGVARIKALRAGIVEVCAESGVDLVHPREKGASGSPGGCRRHCRRDAEEERLGECGGGTSGAGIALLLEFFTRATTRTLRDGWIGKRVLARAATRARRLGVLHREGEGIRCGVRGGEGPCRQLDFQLSTPNFQRSKKRG